MRCSGALQGAIQERRGPSSVLSQVTVTAKRTYHNCVSDSASPSNTGLGPRRASTPSESPQLPKTLLELNLVCAGRLLECLLDGLHTLGFVDYKCVAKVSGWSVEVVARGAPCELLSPSRVNVYIGSVKM
jgi:hypothetical protein